MKQKAILFDLDGTLTDSGEGITKCVKLALDHFGIPFRSLDDLRVFVGPPLRESFLRFGVPEDKIEEAIAVYRSRYTTVGKFENTPYPGIQELLEKLKAQGHRLFVATSKPETMSVEILDKFGLSGYFEAICGATLDQSRDTKSAVIAYLLNKIRGTKDVVMVGDTTFDILGAAEHSIPTIGVSWGYGSVEEMKASGAVAIADSTDELLAMLTTTVVD